MKLNRLAGMLAALMLMLSMFGALAEAPDGTPAFVETTAAGETQPEAPAADPAAGEAQPEAPAADPAAGEIQPEAAPAARQPLYIVLADCGWTLWGDGEIKENSVVSGYGDPDGSVLSLVETVLPKLMNPEAQIMVYGYNDSLRYQNGIAPVSVADQEAIKAQVKALRGLSGRWSSLLHTALEQLTAEIDKLGDGYDITLLIISGGAVNYSDAANMNAALDSEKPPLDRVKSLLDGLRANGVAVDSYVVDLNTSDRLKQEHPGKDGLLLTGDFMGEGYHAISSKDSIDMMANFCDMIIDSYGNGRYNSPNASNLKTADLSRVTSNDLVLVLAEDGRLECYTGATIAADLTNRQNKAAEDEGVRLYSATGLINNIGNAVQINATDRLISLLDSDGNGALDATPEVNAGATVLNLTDLAGHSFAAEDPSVFTAAVDASAGTLMLNAMKAGTTRLIITAADGSARQLNVTVEDYSIAWKLEDGAVVYVNEPTEIAQAADTNKPITVMKTENGGNPQATGNVLTAEQIGEIKVTVQVADREPETRTFRVQRKLAEGQAVQDVALKYPFFRTLEGQNVRVTDAAGNAVNLSEFTVSETTLADVYFGKNGDVMHIVPKAAGTGVIALTDTAGQTITINLTVESLYSGVSFWLLAAAVPVCLIGFTTMIVLLIVKLGGKRR